MAENHLSEIASLEQLLGVQSVEQLKSRLSILVDSLGLDHFACGAMSFKATQAPSVQLLSGYPLDWQAHYDANEYFKQDIVISHTIMERKPLPLVWPEPGTLENPVHDRIFSEAADFGMRSGFTVSCQGPDQIAVLSLSSGTSRKNLFRELTRALGTAQLITCYLQDIWNRLSGDRKPYSTTSLSKREIECLHWAAIGKTSWEIGHILNISERTVVFHIGRAVEKLGVSNRRQAVARAITLGLVRP